MTDILSLLPAYNWQLAFLALVPILFLARIVSFFSRRLSPVLREEFDRDIAAFQKKMENERYAKNQKKYLLQSLLIYLGSFSVTVPFAITIAFQPWWQILISSFIILMAYDFLYYLFHRFVLHDSRLFKGPLVKIHGIHHRERHPVANDVAHVHWFEVALVQLLFVIVYWLYMYFFGSVHIVTVLITWILSQELHRHNHSRWYKDGGPFKYAKYVADLHRAHHIRFNGGNFGVMSPLFDWLFGTLDRAKK